MNDRDRKELSEGEGGRRTLMEHVELECLPRWLERTSREEKELASSSVGKRREQASKREGEGEMEMTWRSDVE
jgi:hypothetical protein